MDDKITLLSGPAGLLRPDICSARVRKDLKRLTRHTSTTNSVAEDRTRPASAGTKAEPRPPTCGSAARPRPHTARTEHKAPKEWEDSKSMNTLERELIDKIPREKWSRWHHPLSNEEAGFIFAYAKYRHRQEMALLKTRPIKFYHMTESWARQHGMVPPQHGSHAVPRSAAQPDSKATAKHRRLHHFGNETHFVKTTEAWLRKMGIDPASNHGQNVMPNYAARYQRQKAEEGLAAPLHTKGAKDRLSVQGTSSSTRPRAPRAPPKNSSTLKKGSSAKVLACKPPKVMQFSGRE